MDRRTFFYAVPDGIVDKVRPLLRPVKYCRERGEDMTVFVLWAIAPDCDYLHDIYARREDAEADMKMLQEQLDAYLKWLKHHDVSEKCPPYSHGYQDTFDIEEREVVDRR